MTAAAKNIVEVPALEVRGLSVEVATEHGRVQLLDDVNLAVARGETLGLVGESGSGKTVTSLAIMQLLPPNASPSGGIYLNGEDITALPPRRLERLRGGDIGMIFQEPRRSLNPAFTVGDQVAEAVRRHHGLSRKAAWSRAVELFDLVGIPNPDKRAASYPHQFSGGMCQRVMLSMALAGNPEVLIADEPTTALDVTVQRQVLELIKDLQRQLGLAVLLITHDLGVVAEVCDRATVMYAGRVVESAPVMDLFNQPRHPYTAGLIDAMPDISRRGEKLAYIAGRVPPARDFVESCRFAPRCPFRVEERCTTHRIPVELVGSRHIVECERVHEIQPRGAFV